MSRIDWWLPEVGDRGVGKTSDGGQNIPTSNLKISKS